MLQLLVCLTQRELVQKRIVQYGEITPVGQLVRFSQVHGSSLLRLLKNMSLQASGVGCGTEWFIRSSTIFLVMVVRSSGVTRLPDSSSMSMPLDESSRAFFLSSFVTLWYRRWKFKHSTQAFQDLGWDTLNLGIGPVEVAMVRNRSGTVEESSGIRASWAQLLEPAWATVPQLQF